MTDEQPMEGLLTALGRLWPEHIVELSSRRGPLPSGSFSTTVERRAVESVAHDRFRVAASFASPRLLLPDDPRCASSAMRRYSSAISMSELLRRSATALALRVGALRLLGDVIALHGGAESIVTFFTELFERPVRVSLGVGTPRANRKPVLGVFDTTGRLIAYAKVGDTPVARGHVEGEARALERLSTVSLRSIEIPRSLFAGEWNSMFVLAMSALETRTLPALLSTRRRPPLDAMAELSMAFDRGRLPLAETGLIRQCSGVIQRLGTDVTAEELRASFERVLEIHGATVVREGAWHGDFTPWNMAYRLSGPIQLWDWERFTEEGLHGLDEIHFLSQQRIRRSGFSPAVMTESLSEIERFHDGSPDWKALEAAYLLSLACRYVAASREEGGEMIQSNADTVLTVLGNTTK